MKHILLFGLLLFGLSLQSTAQTKCDSMLYSPDTFYITQGVDTHIFDTLHYSGDDIFDYAVISFYFPDTSIINITDWSATSGVWGPMTHINPFGNTVLYNTQNIPENTVVQAYRVIQHFSLFPDSCVKPVTFVINPASPLSVHGKSRQNDIKVYPNPIHTNATFDISGQGRCTDIVLWDLTGKEVMHLNVRSAKTVISRKGLSDGIYILQLLNGNQHLATKKVVLATQ